MSLELTAQAEAEIWMEAEQQYPPVTSIDRLETICSVPTALGSGYVREVDLYPGLGRLPDVHHADEGRRSQQQFRE